MKHISELTGLILTKPSSTHSTSPTHYSDEQKKNIKRLFLMMKAGYQHKFTSSYKTADDVKLAMQLWLKAFGHYEWQHLEHALMRAADISEWPPTIAEFKQHLAVVVRQSVVPRPALPRPLPDKDKAAAAIEGIRQALRRQR